MLEAKIALLVKNTGRYISRFYNDDSINAIRGSKQAIDSPSTFLIIPLDDNHIALQSDDGTYWGRILRSHNTSWIESSKTSPNDPYAKFAINYEAENLITLKADNGEYLHSGENFYIQTMSSLNDSCRFYITTLFS
jgi:hypothetical protein